MTKSECRLLNIMKRDLSLPNDQCVRIIGKGDTLKEVFQNKLSKWKFENDTKYTEIMKSINDFLLANGMNDTVFSNPEDYETSYEEFHYFYSDKAIDEYMFEEEERCLTASPLSHSESGVKTIFLGTFHQSDSSKKEPVEWIVLTEDKSKMLLLSKRCLESRAYFKDSPYMNDWDQSDIRLWLNDTFYNEAFSEAEKALITDNGDNTDKIFLLNEKSAKRFILNNNIDLKSKPTQYAINNGARTDKDGFCWWWLAWEKSNVSLPLVPTVSCRGSMGLRIESNRENIGVRPAMWIKI